MKIFNHIHIDFILVTKNDLQKDQSLNCSQFSSDTEIISSFPFDVPPNPVPETPEITYRLMNSDEKVYYLNIVNQESVPYNIFCLKSLQTLYIRNTSFYEIDLNDNSVRRLPTEIEHFAASLIVLRIFDTPITHLPKQISKLTRLILLELSNTGLVSLSDAIGDLSSLNTLSLSNNKLTSLPTTMINLRLLLQIILKNNIHLRSIQSLNGLPSLQELDARHCSIERIPLHLPKLTNLLMSNNNLTNLIDIQTLGNKVNNTKYFNFDSNYIQSISHQIQHVNNLYWLNLNNNRLETLPLDISKVTTLSHLYIRQNRFRRWDLKEIIDKFNRTNPKLKIYYQTNKKQ
jgi:hypothetical protein